MQIVVYLRSASRPGKTLGLITFLLHPEIQLVDASASCEVGRDSCLTVVDAAAVRAVYYEVPLVTCGADRSQWPGDLGDLVHRVARVSLIRRYTERLLSQVGNTLASSREVGLVSQRPG